MQPLAPREIWPHEAHDLTRWLLLNADVLSGVFGRQLELTEAGHSVGEFSLDLIGRDPATGDVVIAGNELKRTDDSYLGRLPTYAGGIYALNIVWFTRSFHEAHRQVGTFIAAFCPACGGP